MPDVEQVLSEIDCGGGTPLGAIIARKVIRHLFDHGYVIVPNDPYHYVTFDYTGWFIEHSVACRQAGTLGTCDYNSAIREVADDDPDLIGRWKIRDLDGEGLPSLERADV
jgi:hypothetical protein